MSESTHEIDIRSDFVRHSDNTNSQRVSKQLAQIKQEFTQMNRFTLVYGASVVPNQTASRLDYLKNKKIK